MNDDSKRELDVFTEALELPVAERAAFLNRACAGNEGLRHKVEALLKVHERTGDFLEHAPTGSVVEAMREVPVAKKPEDQIGRYKLLQQIGEGGCGVVFMAEQEEPVRRRVALKILKPGMDTKSVVARFEAERQALALMDHPNIAKIFDAGETPSGRPYFVMELIRGIKITDYCDQTSLTTEERLELFVQVCQAVQHAHQKGVIHRDIKPSNIMVTTSLEGAALPVVIDFGIAKAATNQRLTDKTLFTAFEMLIGTPAYMSPEQAALASLDVDTRTDIYSLGVLLYELLAGSTPFDTAELLKAGLDEIRRVIREQEPVRPSTRLSKLTVADLTTVAQNRKSEPPKLIRTISGDLDWIVMKAIEKDRTRRYETANGLAMDVKRYLTGEAISARPPSRLYKFQKIFLRNKLLFVGIGIIAMLLIAGLIVVSTSLARERQARQESDGDKLKAQQVTKFLKDMLQGVGPGVALGQDTKMLRGILDQTAQRVGKEMTNQPAVEAELRNLIGTLYQRIGNYDQAEQMHSAALAIRRKLFGSTSAEVAASLNDLGVELMAARKLSEAETAVGEALAIRRKLFGNGNGDTATSLNDLSAVYRETGRLKEAEAMAREALGIRRKLFGAEHLEVVDSLRNLCIILGDEGKWAESEAMAREVLAMRRKALGPEHPWVAAALADVAWAAGANGKLDEAETLEREALAMRQKLLPETHPDVAKSLYLVGDRMRQRGKLNESQSILIAALTIQRKLLGEENQASLDTLRSLASTLEAENKLGEAEAVHREILAVWRKRGENEIPEALSELESLTHNLIGQKKFGEAEQLLNEALVPEFVRKPISAKLLVLRLDLKARRGQWQEAAADAALVFQYQPSYTENYCVLAALLAKTQNRPAYEQFCQKILATHTNTTDLFLADRLAKACLFLPSSEVDLKVVGHLADTTVTLGVRDKGAMPFFQVCKALSEYRQGHFVEASDWAQKTLKIPGNYAHGHASAVLAMAYWRLGKKEEAQGMLAKGETLCPRIMPLSIAEERGNGWTVWLFARVSLDEATDLIQPGVTNDVNSNHP
jgi:eukaryotic-like serine/threonine-protein kinase